MIRLDRQQAIEDLCRLSLSRVRLVGRRVVGDPENRERVEDRRLVVAGAALRHAGHGLVVGYDARRVRHSIALVVGADRGDVVALTRARRSHGRRLLRCRSSGREFVVRGRPPDGVEIGHREPPLRHPATGILRRNLLEGLRGLDVSEGVQQRQPALEHRLNLGVTRRGKPDLPELLRRGVRVIVLVLGECPSGRERKGHRESVSATERLHGFPLDLEGRRFCHDARNRSMRTRMKDQRAP